jgi:hypothetical protein
VDPIGAGIPKTGVSKTWKIRTLEGSRVSNYQVCLYYLRAAFLSPKRKSHLKDLLRSRIIREINIPRDHPNHRSRTPSAFAIQQKLYV